MSIEAVLNGKTLPTNELCQVLMDEVKNRHARLHHPFYRDLFEGKLPYRSRAHLGQGSLGHLRL